MANGGCHGCLVMVLDPVGESRAYQSSSYSIRQILSTPIAFGLTNYDTPEEILRDADTAMYRAKKQGKSCHAVFDQGHACRGGQDAATSD